MVARKWDKPSRVERVMSSELWPRPAQAGQTECPHCRRARVSTHTLPRLCPVCGYHIERIVVQLEAVAKRQAAQWAKRDAKREAGKKASAARGKAKARAALCVAACEGVQDADLRPGLLKELILVGIK